MQRFCLRIETSTAGCYSQALISRFASIAAAPWLCQPHLLLDRAGFVVHSWWLDVSVRDQELFAFLPQARCLVGY
jgi:hypothetical protein